ncbi:hypothetical protein MUCCIDRAFT_79547 [Mucor lusitanicus CBS 277.49]|uniref:Uncharacterized protein n=2 Tax=Mucor circinelloides f. lusitanicus TaxID=29924 RepID=A0A168M636_MUCCL|nr:hypothetical protein MUCCIDRAFT_79547 [Mucor lusitanicus CBS 277.49]
MSVITSPNIFRRMSMHLPSKMNAINPSSGSNSTCPLPQSDKEELDKRDGQFKVSHDITMLYELFSSLVSPKLASSQGAAAAAAADTPICLCCERKITSQVCQLNHRQHETSHNRTTFALFYGSHHVKKYMRHVMTKNNMTNIINYGFPCPHAALGKANVPMIHYYCERCENQDKQETIRLTLTPTHCRADDDAIYKNAYTTAPDQDQPQSKRMKKRRGCIFLFVR